MARWNINTEIYIFSFLVRMSHRVTVSSQSPETYSTTSGQWTGWHNKVYKERDWYSGVIYQVGYTLWHTDVVVDKKPGSVMGYILEMTSQLNPTVTASGVNAMLDRYHSYFLLHV